MTGAVQPRVFEGLDEFFESAAMPMHWVGADGTILRANQAELDLLGYGRDEYVGRNIADFHADPQTIAEILRRLKNGETLHDYPARLQRKDGTVKEVRITSNVNWQNQRFMHTRCFTRDVTQTVDYLEGLLEGFVAYDGDWVMTYMNAAAERLLNRRREEVLGKTWHQAFPHAPGNPVDQMYQRVMRTRQAERMEYFYPHYGRWLEISAAAVRSGGVAVYFRDITERRRAEEALREADRRKDEFLAMLAHELRNPLAPIRNALHLMRVCGGAGPVADEAQQVMERQLAQLIRLVDDLLEVSRISRGKIELRRASVDLGAVVASAVETSRPAIDAARHRLEVRLPPAPLRVHGDFVRLAQVIANLLNNAAKYTDPGGRVAVSVEQQGSEAAIRVQDSGIGLAPELLPRIFDMFAQADRARAAGGLGIGLALAKMLVDLHGGRIEAKSDGPGQGSEFAVRLPLAV
jgi:PAS domain S-box-containing protein